jgi:hypothetical protein
MSPQVAVVPESVHGAVPLSVIDFFLSFVAISFIGFILALFPYLNRTGPCKGRRWRSPSCLREMGTPNMWR